MAELTDEAVYALSQAARQEFLNAAIFRIIEKEGGEVHLTFDDMKPEDMGGISIEANYEEGTLVLRTVSLEELAAWQESCNQPKQ